MLVVVNMSAALLTMIPTKFNVIISSNRNWIFYLPDIHSTRSFFQPNSHPLEEGVQKG